MAKKKPKAGIPLRSRFKDESFWRNWKVFQRERETRDEALFDAITDELLSNAKENVIRDEKEQQHQSDGGKAIRWTVAWKHELADLMLENTRDIEKGRFAEAMKWLSSAVESAMRSEYTDYGYELPNLGGEVYVDGDRICYYSDGDDNTSPKRNNIGIKSFRTGPFRKRKEANE